MEMKVVKIAKGMTQAMESNIKEKITYAFTNFPNQYTDICNYIRQRMEEDYGGLWFVILNEQFKGSYSIYYDQGTDIEIYYLGYSITIFRHNNQTSK